MSRPFEGEMRTVTISKTKTNKYFASILAQDNKPLPKPKKIKVVKPPKIKIIEPNSMMQRLQSYHDKMDAVLKECEGVGRILILPKKKGPTPARDWQFAY